MIRFSYYKGTDKSIEKEKVVTHVINLMREHLILPECIEIQFVHLGPASYGEAILSQTDINIIRINLDLAATDLIIPVLHELIHLDQVACGHLSSTRYGDIAWNGTKYSNNSSMNYTDYANLPWEIDVAERLPNLLNILLSK